MLVVRASQPIDLGVDAERGGCGRFHPFETFDPMSQVVAASPIHRRIPPLRVSLNVPAGVRLPA